MAETSQDPSSSPRAGNTPSTKPKGWQPPTTEELQQLLPQYEITALLGRGGMGAVYKGRQKNLDRLVAIKILPPGMDDEDSGAQFAERFKNEARAMARLSHVGIVAVYDSGETPDGLLYIVMEFIEGTDVQKMVSEQRRLRSEHAMAITAHVCDALQYAHERGIVHRDIKPANIMVGYDGVVKVADFGLAKMERAGESALTRSGMAMGTLHYMAPEALMLGTSVDHRADIYAVGVMLYYMLTGKLPQGMFELPSLQVPGLDPRYDAIITKALRDDRDIRYQSAAEMRRELDSILTQPVVKVSAGAQQAPAALPTEARPKAPAGQQGYYRPPAAQMEIRVEKRGSPLLWIAIVVMSGLAFWLWLDRQPASRTALAEAEQAKEALPGGGNPSPTSTQSATGSKEADLPVTQNVTPGVWHDMFAEKLLNTSGLQRTADSSYAEPYYLVTSSSAHKITPHVFRDCIVRMRFSGEWRTEPVLFLRCILSNNVLESMSAKFEGPVARLSRHYSPNSIQTLSSMAMETPLARSKSVVVELKVVGDKYTLIRDGVVVTEAVDSTYITGRAGIFVTQGTIIEKLEIMPLAAETASASTSVAQTSASDDWRPLLEDKPELVQKLQITDVTTAPGWKVMQKGFAPVLDAKNVALRLNARSYKTLRLVARWSETPHEGIFGHTLRVGPDTSGNIQMFCGWINQTTTVNGVLQPGTYESTQQNPPFEVPEGQEYELELRSFENRLVVLVDGKGRLDRVVELPGHVIALHPYGPLEFKDLSWRPLPPESKPVVSSQPAQLPSTSPEPPAASSPLSTLKPGVWHDMIQENLISTAGMQKVSAGDTSVTKYLTTSSTLQKISTQTFQDCIVRGRFSGEWESEPSLFVRKLQPNSYQYISARFSGYRASLNLHRLIDTNKTSYKPFSSTANMATPLVRNESFELELRVVGDAYTLLRDGKVVTQGNDSTYAKGHVGFYVMKGTIIEKLEIMPLDGLSEQEIAAALLAGKTTGGEQSPTPRETQTMKLLVDASFSQPVSGFPDSSSKNIAAAWKDGSYQLTALSSAIWWPAIPALQKLRVQDFVCEVEVRVPREAEGSWGIGLIPPSGSGVPWIGTKLDASGRAEIYRYNGLALVPWTKTAAKSAGAEWNKVRIEVSGPRLRLFVNDLFVAEAPTNERPPPNALTLFLHTPKPALEAWFRRMRVWEPQDAAAATQTTPQPTATTAPPVMTLPTGPTTWTDVKGRRITATFKAIASGNVLLDIAGKVTPVPLNALSAESQKLARDYQQQTPPTTASTTAAAFTNTLGMKFVPVPGTQVLFCIHETRYSDFAAFASEVRILTTSWKNQTYSGIEISTRNEEHPVTYVTPKQAVQFCAWLSLKEDKKYRLPTQEEWSLAAIGGVKAEFPWGAAWPPPKNVGNYADESYHKLRPTDPFLPAYDDGYPTTAPVMSFKPNALGIYDLGGNVWEMNHVGDPAAAAFNDFPPMVDRGASFLHDAQKTLRSANEHTFGSNTAPDRGFRIVLEPTS